MRIAAYVRTPVQNPLLSLTASVTLREQSTHTKTRPSDGVSVDTASIRSGTDTIRTDRAENEGYEEEEEELDMAGMDEIDLLGGLAGGESTHLAVRFAAHGSVASDSSRPIHTPGSTSTSAKRYFYPSDEFDYCCFL